MWTHRGTQARREAALYSGEPGAGPTEGQAGVATSVAVVIPNWNGAALLPACLAALQVQTHHDHEVVVVDNGSTDTSLAVLGRFPAVRVLRLGRNRGFGAATNAGIRATASRYVATLNSDAVPGPTWLAALVAAAEADP